MTLQYTISGADNIALKPGSTNRYSGAYSGGPITISGTISITLAPGHVSAVSMSADIAGTSKWQWPAAGGKFGTAVLYADKFATKDGKGVFAPVAYKAVEAAGGEYPFAVQGQWPMGTLSKNTHEIMREFSEPTVRINKVDAKALGIISGSTVKVTGKAGSVEIVAEVTEDIKKGVVSMPATIGAAVVKIEKTQGGN